MDGGSRIIDLRRRNSAATLADEASMPEPVATEPREFHQAMDDFIEFNDDDEPQRGPWIVPVLGIVVALGWICGMLWLSWPTVQQLAPIELTGFIAALCVPPALIGILLLLALRTSTAEARRFGRTAGAMRAEATNLERRVAALVNTLDATRAELAEQASSLLAIGEGAVAQLAGVGTGIAEQVDVADQRARKLAAAAAAAETSLGILIATLPKAHGETESLARLLEQTGMSAGLHASALDAQLVALAERGREADAVASGAAQKLAAHITRMEATSETAGARLEAVTGEMSSAVDALLGRTAGAVDEARKGIAAQGDAMLAMLGTNQAALDRVSRDSAEALAARITTIEQIIDRINARLGEQRSTSEMVIGELDIGLTRVSRQLDALHAQGVDRTQSLATSISALGSAADAMTLVLRTGDGVATSAISTAENLLLALDAAARELDETLPAALARLDARIADSRRGVGEVKPELVALVTAAESTHDAVDAIAQSIASQRETIDKLSGKLLETLDSGRTRANALDEMVEETIGRTNRFTEEAAPRLVEALLRVHETASAAADRARETLTSVIPEAALALEQAGAEAMQRASSVTVERQIAAILDAGDAATEAAQRMSERLTRQMLAIADSTAKVESRIEDARTEREEADRESFARRVSLLIEALNSASIDIAKCFSNEVSDSAWAAYLKGDRGIFTRRAVRLLDTGEARDIARLYEEDPAFREQVNRYVHDFEAMLRTILGQPDGSPLGVTLLSSDMGKLYVALAQAIRRLRG